MTSNVTAISPVNWCVNPKLQRCVEVMIRGGQICYPTEAVWGLGCDPFNVHAVDGLLRLKSRPWQKGLILVAASTAQIDFLLRDLSRDELETVKSDWPGPTTWLLPHHGRVPENVCGNHDTVAVRVSSHPVVRALCLSFGAPIVSTSANPRNLTPARTAWQARRYFRGKELCYCPGAVAGRKSPSTIKDLATGRIIRAS